MHELRCYPVLLFKVAGVQAGHQLPSFVALKVLLQVVMPGLIVHGRVLRRVLRPVQCGWGRRALPEAVANWLLPGPKRLDWPFKLSSFWYL